MNANSAESTLIRYKYDFQDAPKSIEIIKKEQGRALKLDTYKVPRAYKSRITISLEKKKDLISLCDG